VLLVVMAAAEDSDGCNRDGDGDTLEESDDVRKIKEEWTRLQMVSNKKHSLQVSPLLLLKHNYTCM
jgi:hypothetical protein